MNATSLDLQSMRARMGVPRTAVTTTAAQQSAPPEMGTDEEECPAFGYLRGIRDRALSLELRFANGNSESHSYSWLGPMKYNPSAGLLLKLVGDMVYLVLLEGSNLNTLVNGSVSLYSGIQRHRITWVREMTSQQAARAGAGEVTIERIHLLSHRPDEEPKGVQWLEPFKEKPAPASGS